MAEERVALYGAASRPDAPSMPLQAVWTQDSGGLPPWKGDFHHDLNTQMTYLSYLPAGRFEEGNVFLDFMYGLLPRFKEFAALAEQKFREDLYHSITLPGGAGQECPGYVAHAMKSWTALAPACRQYLGFDPTRQP